MVFIRNLRSKFIFFFLLFILLVLGLEFFLFFKFKTRNIESDIDTYSKSEELKTVSLKQDLAGQKVVGKILDLNRREKYVKIEFINNGKRREAKTQFTSIAWLPKNGNYDPNKAPSLDDLSKQENLEMTLSSNGVLEIYY